MIFQNLHSHTFYDDGQCTADMMVKGAIEAGLDSIGICCHSPILRQDATWCIKPRDINDFKRDVYTVRDKYSRHINVYCGVELDNMTERKLDLYGFEYVIGAVHFLPLPDGTAEHLEYETIDRFPSEDGGLAVQYREVDLSRKALEHYIQAGYDGDAMATAELYYSQYKRMATDKTVDIVAHYDLITKFDEPETTLPANMLFDITNPQYLEAAIEGMRILVQHDKIFEVNTGAVSRGYRQSFYPTRRLLRELKNMGGRITLATDAHRPEHAGFMLEEAARYAMDCGFKEIWVMDKGKFVPSQIKD
jgi:histidinol-phosphatase (PHP family)